MDGNDNREDAQATAEVASQELQPVRAVTRSRLRAARLPWLGALAVVIAICAGLVASGALRGSASAPGADGFQKTGFFGCFGSGPGFTTDQLPTGGPGAESETGARAAALRAFIAQNPDMPTSGWKLVRESGSTVTYLAPFPMGGYVEVSLEPGTPDGASYGADGWRTSGYGGCPLMAVPPSGYSSATWGLDPAVPYTPGATELHLLVDELGCHGNSTAEGRIFQNVEYASGDVVVTLAVLARSGFQTCPGTPPTPYVVHLTQPVATRDLFDGGVWPQVMIATAGRPFFTPTPTPEPASWHMPIDCTGEATDGAGSFKASSMSAKFDVYCAVLPSGWQRTAMSDAGYVVNSITATYHGPQGEVLELTEGNFCTESATACAPGSPLGTAMFGHRRGQLLASPPGADYALYVDQGLSPSWKAVGSGMTLDTFKALTAALIVVAK